MLNKYPKIERNIQNWQREFLRIRGQRAKAGSIKDLFELGYGGSRPSEPKDIMAISRALSKAQVNAAFWAVAKSRHQEVWTMCVLLVMQEFDQYEDLVSDREVLLPTLDLLRKADEKGHSDRFNGNLRKLIKNFLSKTILAFCPKDSDVAPVLVAIVCDYGCYDYFWYKKTGELDERWAGSEVVIEELYTRLQKRLTKNPNLSDFRSSIYNEDEFATQLWKHLGVGSEHSKKVIQQLRPDLR